MVNETLRKKKEDFLKGITKVFNECKRILKDDGLLIFTFHHKKDEAWASMLKAVVDAGFYVSAIHPVYAEMRTSFHIFEKNAVLYDTIIVCRKRTKTTEGINLSQIIDEALAYTRNIIKEFVSKKQDFKYIDIIMAGRSKCMELYSKHYPNIKNKGKTPSVFEVLKAVDQKIKDMLKEEKGKFKQWNMTLEKFIR